MYDVVLHTWLPSISSIRWWRTVGSPWQFAILGLLACLVLHRVLKAVADLALTGYMLVLGNQPGLDEHALEILTVEALVVDLLAVLGILLLQWLRARLPKA